MASIFDSLGQSLYDTGLFGSNGIVEPKDTFFNPVNNGQDVGNYDDAESWERYLQVLNQSNLYNSAEAEKLRDFNLMLRDTHISSIMKQLKENGINPIIAFNNGANLPGYSTSGQAQAYSGTSPYSNQSRIDAAIIRAVGSIIGDVISGIFGNSAATIASNSRVETAKIAAAAKSKAK